MTMIMTNKKIPRSIKDIMDVFIKSNFIPLTYEIIAKNLNLETNTVVQRINRNQAYFTFKGTKPKFIMLKKGIKEIYFYRDKNQCQICRKTFPPDKLIIRYKNPHLKKKDNWGNVLTSCENCKSVDILKKTRKKQAEPVKQKQIITWEYKEIFIKQIDNRQANYYQNVFPIKYEDEDDGKIDEYYEYDELDGRGWFHLIDDDDDKISSLKVSDILNYFGEYGWELVKFNEEFDKEDPDQVEFYYCIFKRKRIKE